MTFQFFYIIRKISSALREFHKFLIKLFFQQVHGSLVDEKSPIHQYDSEGEESTASSVVTGGTQTPPSRLQHDLKFNNNNNDTIANNNTKTPAASSNRFTDVTSAAQHSYHHSHLTHPHAALSHANSHHLHSHHAHQNQLAPPPQPSTTPNSSSSAPSPALNTNSPSSSQTAATASMLVGHHNHHLLYHPQHPNDWYHPTTPTGHETMNHLNHFSHHHHHLVHHGPATAY